MWGESIGRGRRMQQESESTLKSIVYQWQARSRETGKNAHVELIADLSNHRSQGLSPSPTSSTGAA